MNECIKNIDNMNDDNKNNNFIPKLDTIKKIIILMNNCIIAGAAPNQKIIIINEDRLAYKVDQLFSGLNIISNDIKCGKLQTNKKTFIEHLEDIPINILKQFYEILDYDRCIYNIN